MTTTHQRLGIVFDIDGLADFMYGFAAYRLLFRTVLAANPQLLNNCRFWDGDTRATLDGSARDYVIAVESPDAAVLGELHHVMQGIEDMAFKPVASRFLVEEAVAREPLVVAARVNPLGAMDWCDTSFVRNAWNEELKALQSPSTLPRNQDGKQRAPD